VAQQDAQPQLVGEVIPPDQQDGVRESGYYTLTSGSDSQQAFTQDGQYFGGNFGFGSYPGSSSQFQPVSSSYQQPQYQQTLTTGIASVSQSYLPTSVYQTVPQQTSQQQSSQQPTQQPSHQTSQQQVDQQQQQQQPHQQQQHQSEYYSHINSQVPVGSGTSAISSQHHMGMAQPQVLSSQGVIVGASSLVMASQPMAGLSHPLVMASVPMVVPSISSVAMSQHISQPVVSVMSQLSGITPQPPLSSQPLVLPTQPASLLSQASMIPSQPNVLSSLPQVFSQASVLPPHSQTVLPQSVGNISQAPVVSETSGIMPHLRMAPQSVVASQPLPVPQSITASQPGVATQPVIASQPVLVSQPIIGPLIADTSQSMVGTHPVIMPQPVVHSQPVVASQPLDASQAGISSQPGVASQSVCSVQAVMASQSVLTSHPEESSQAVIASQPLATSQSHGGVSQAESLALSSVSMPNVMALQGSSSELVQTVTPQSVVVPTLVPSQLSTIFMQPPGASTSVPESVSSILPSTTTSHPGVIQSHLLSVSTSQPSVASQQVTSAQPTVTMSQQGPSALQDGGLPSQSEGVASQPAALQCQPSVVPSLPGVVSSVPPLGASLSSSTVASDANQVETCPSPQILPDTYSHLLNDRPGGTGLESQTNNSITSSNTTSSTITTTMPSSSNTTITSSTHPPFDPSAASESECSEHPADGSSSKQHMGRKKIRKKKTLDRFPKLTVLSVTDTMVECQLETVKQKTITFKFDITDNDPQDVAYKLVMTNLLPGNHAEVVINYIEDIIRQLQVNPNVLPVVSIPGLDSPGQQHSQDGPTRSPSASRRHRDDPETRHEEGGDSAPPTPSKRAEHRESLSHGSTSPV
ncbi:hypothetical protein OTU49_015105, partial [Cherax quadricarinatus]